MTIPDSKKEIKITLDKKALAELERIAGELGVTKSAAISFLIKTF